MLSNDSLFEQAHFFWRGPFRFLLVLYFGLFFYLLDKLIFFVFNVDFKTPTDFFLTWFFSVIVLRLREKLSLALGLLTFSLVPLFLALKIEKWADQAAVYALVFLLIGVLQRVWCERIE